MASSAGSTTVAHGTMSAFPASKLLIAERLKKRHFIRTDVDSRQPLVTTFTRSMDETDRLPRKLRVHLHSVVFAVFSALAYMFDFLTDIIVGMSQLRQCRVIEGALVLLFAFVPSIFVNTLGFLWVVDDLKSRPQNRVTNRFKKPVWIFGILSQIIPALYSLESAYYYCKFRQLLAANNGIVDAMILELYYWIMESDRDSTLLRVFIAFLESAPQLLLQAYVLCRYLIDHNASTSLYAWIHYISIASSLLGLSWSLMSQHRCLRYIRQDKENLGIWHCILIFLWRTLTLIGRFIALLLFTLAFTYWLALLLSIHYLLILAVLLCIEQPKLAHSAFQQSLLIIGVAWVHLFCPWNVDEGHTRYRYLWRYGLEWLEFMAVVLCLYFAPTEIQFSGKAVFIIVAACCYIAGVLIMCVYYSCCHPNMTRGRRRYPPLVVVYTPPEKVSAISGYDPNAASNIVAVSVPDQSSAIIRRQGRFDSSDEDIGCCGRRGGSARGEVSCRSINEDHEGGGCDGGWGSTNEGGKPDGSVGGAESCPSPGDGGGGSFSVPGGGGGGSSPGGCVGDGDGGD